jgi:aspartyl/asparaginyl beta-hydroxylase (cupin superfamily)
MLGPTSAGLICYTDMAEHPPVPTPAFSESDAETRLASNHGDIQAILAKADHRFFASDYRAAAAFYAAVVKAVQQQGATSAGMARDAKRAAAMGVYFQQLFKDHLLSSLDKAGFTKSNRHPRFQKSLEMMLGERERPPEYQRFPQTPLVYFYPDLPYVDFANAADFDWIPALESAFSVVRNEAAKLLEGQVDFRPYIQANKQRPQGDVHGMLENPDWSTLFLWQNGAAVDDHVALCPATFEAVTTKVPLCHIGPRAPSVMLSLLRPGAHIPPHTGMINCRYICHLPLIVPENCGFRVGEKTIGWEEGKVILFDDTVQHEAWNRSAKDRLVLIFDVWRPELGLDEREMITALFAAVDSY